MTCIHLETIIRASVEACFDLSRSVELHLQSTAQTNETVVDGKTEGLLNLDDVITWQATHFGIRQILTVKITELDYPNYFCDEMLKGAFKSMRHTHFFYAKEGYTLIVEEFQYEVPYGIFGQLFDVLVLKNYMTRFLQKRNAVIAHVAEGGK